MQRPGDPAARSRSTRGCTRPGLPSTPAARTCSCRSATPSSTPRDERDDELRRLQLQYRDRLEFARRPHLLGRLGRRPRRPPRHRGLDDLAADVRDAADHGGGGRCGAAGHAELAVGRPRTSCAAGLTPIVSGYRGVARRRAGARRARCPSTCAPRRLDAVAEARKVAAAARRGPGAPARRRRRGAALLPVHEPGDGRPAHPDPGRGAPRPSPEAEHRRGSRRRSWPTRGRGRTRGAPSSSPSSSCSLPMLTDPAAPKRSGDRRARRSCCSSPPVAARPRPTSGSPRTRSRSVAARASWTTADGPLDGRAGVAVLMRYTLRLLTAQQFQRATALVCAAELARAADPGDVGRGAVPDRAVGRHRREPEAVRRGRRSSSRSVNERSRLPADRPADPALPVVRHPHRAPATSAPAPATRRVHVYCGDDLAARALCPFSAGRRRSTSGLPVLTVDEEIYRLAPSFVIATVDKFARLAREGEAAALFGLRRTPLRAARLRPPRLPALRHQGRQQARREGRATGRGGAPGARGCARRTSSSRTSCTSSPARSAPPWGCSRWPSTS